MSTLSQAAINLEHSKDYFYVMKCQQKKKYNFISNLPGNTFQQKYFYYLDLQHNTIVSLQELYYWLEDNQLIFRFSTYLVEQGLSKNTRSFSTTAKFVIFGANNIFKTHRSFIRYSNILPILIKFKNNYIKEHNNDTS